MTSIIRWCFRMFRVYNFWRPALFIWSLPALRYYNIASLAPLFLVYGLNIFTQYYTGCLRRNLFDSDELLWSCNGPGGFLSVLQREISYSDLVFTSVLQVAMMSSNRTTSPRSSSWNCSLLISLRFFSSMGWLCSCRRHTSCPVRGALLKGMCCFV